MLIQMDGVKLTQKTKSYRNSPSYEQEKKLFRIYIDVYVCADFYEKETRVEYVFKISLRNSNQKRIDSPTEFTALGEIKQFKTYDHSDFDSFYKEAVDISYELRKNFVDLEKGLGICHELIQNNTVKL